MHVYKSSIPTRVASRSYYLSTKVIPDNALLARFPFPPPEFAPVVVFVCRSAVADKDIGNAEFVVPDPEGRFAGLLQGIESSSTWPPKQLKLRALIISHFLT